MKNMIAEILAISAAGAAAFTIVDHENMLGNNPEKKWFWERPPFAPAPAAVQMRSQQFVPPLTPRFTPQQELSMARQGVINSERMVEVVIKNHPGLVQNSKYAITA